LNLRSVTDNPQFRSNLLFLPAPPFGRHLADPAGRSR
jgi:hypothetical protein